MEVPQGRRPKRWGIRTLAFLALSAAAIVLSNLLYTAGNSDFVLLTFAATLVGLAGATYCSIRGILAWNSRPRY